MALEGLSPPAGPPLPMPEVKLGVDGRPKVGEDTRLPEDEGGIMELGRARRDGERPPPGGRGDEERAGGLGPVPVNFFWVRVREKIAWDRDDCAFISVSLVRLIEVPLRMRLWKVCQYTCAAKHVQNDLLHDLSRILDLYLAKSTPNNVTIFIFSNLNLATTT